MWRLVAAVVGALGLTGVAAAVDDGPCPPDRAAWIASAGEAAPSDAGGDDAPSRMSVRGQKLAGRPMNRSEAGLSWALGRHLAVELNYARNAFPPMMPNDHDDGLITRLKLGF